MQAKKLISQAIFQFKKAKDNLTRAMCMGVYKNYTLLKTWLILHESTKAICIYIHMHPTSRHLRKIYVLRRLIFHIYAFSFLFSLPVLQAFGRIKVVVVILIIIEME